MDYMTSYPEHNTKLQDALNVFNYPSGILVTPTPITLGEEITIYYAGLLFRNGAEQIWFHYGYGDNKEWNIVRELNMEKTNNGFMLKLRPSQPTKLNFCFRDSAENWDNNEGKNWSYEVHNGQYS